LRTKKGKINNREARAIFGPPGAGAIKSGSSKGLGKPYQTSPNLLCMCHTMSTVSRGFSQVPTNQATMPWCVEIGEHLS